jgi:hypothetical protein
MAIQVTARQARQLHLFKSRKPRGTLPPAPSEFQIHIAVADVLRRWALPTVEWVRIADHMRRAGHRFEVVDKCRRGDRDAGCLGVVRSMTTQMQMIG